MAAGTRAIQEMRFLAEIGHRHRTAGFSHFSGNAFAWFIGDIQPVNVDVMGDIQPDFLLIAIQK